MAATKLHSAERVEGGAPVEHDTDVDGQSEAETGKADSRPEKKTVQPKAEAGGAPEQAASQAPTDVEVSVPGQGTIVEVSDPGLGTRVEVSDPGLGTRVEVSAPGLGTRVEVSDPGLGTIVEVSDPGLGTRVEVSDPGLGTRVEVSDPGLGTRVEVSAPGLGTRVEVSDPGLGTRVEVSAPGLGTRVEVSDPGLGTRVEVSDPGLGTRVEVSAPGQSTRVPASVQSQPRQDSDPGDGHTARDSKEESGCLALVCDKSKASVEDDKVKSGDGDTRRPSLEVSSSDGEPLSRVDSEDSISSTLMEMDSTVSSGRSTPAMMNGLGSASSSATKTVAYSCSWDLCLQYFNSSPDLAEHIRSIHVDGQRGGVFVCLWKGCKVYNTPSTSQSWLQRHMLTHSGDKPFKCVVGGCTASFASQGGLARHVPSHFSQQSSSKMSSQAKLKEELPSKAGLNKRKKLKNKRRCSLPRPHDFFDAQTMDAIRHRAICLNLATHIESVGNGHSVVFNSTVLAKRKEGSGKVNVLLHWTPEDILPDVWVNETERCQLKTKVVHLSQLPQDTAMLLDPNIYRALSQKRLKQSVLVRSESHT
ncbi:zinc finger protein AEBP2-like isoform X2 [Nerophis ophidion]|uniref:zinc finger protein AEBP2-like isoform X2 n=1 Tax=Nerophis ophidion TaxID=159077 RepID=UPI002AE02B34|nr:zinc finger protein AEBP2-like isoform X2 [Nerophis ophidion]